MSKFLEQKKKREEDETSPASSETQEASADDQAEEDEVAPEAASLHEDPDTEELEGELEEDQEVDHLHAALEDANEEVARLARTNEKLEQELKVLEERIEELEDAGNVSEGWMGPHEANKLREENQMYKIKVQNQNREIQRLKNQVRVGHR